MGGGVPGGGVFGRGSRPTVQGMFAAVEGAVGKQLGATVAVGGGGGAGAMWAVAELVGAYARAGFVPEATTVEMMGKVVEEW